MNIWRTVNYSLIALATLFAVLEKILDSSVLDWIGWICLMAGTLMLPKTIKFEKEQQRTKK